MIYSIDCIASINSQDPDYPTYIKIDCTLHCNANENWYGKKIDCTATIISIIMAACKSFNQGIRLKVVIDDVDVSEALIGSLNIQHSKNKISTFTLELGDNQYSPRINSHIDVDKPVVITVYINGQEKKLFTGLIDEAEAENTPAFRVIVSGRDYGKKLLDKIMTLISVQDLASSSKRNCVIKYIAEQAGITNIDIPEMDPVTIDNSFQEQSLWDMIQKEAMVELCWVKFTEDNIMQLKRDEIKSDTDVYPTPDWTYDEDKIIRLSYKKSRIDINKIIILGKRTLRRIPHTDTTQMINPADDSSYSGKPEDYYKNPVLLFFDSLNFSDGELIEPNPGNNYSKTVGNFTLKIYSYSHSAAGGNIHIHVGCQGQTTWESYIITSKSGTIGGNAKITRVYDSISAGSPVNLHGICWVIERDGTGTNFEKGKHGSAFTFEISVYGYRRRNEIVYDEEEQVYIANTTSETSTTYETRYDQISALVIDPNSIEKYGERNGGSIEYPLLETEAQCRAVGSKIIRDSHRLGQQVDFEIPFNPLIQTGETISVRDKKINITERYYIEKVTHNINIGAEGIKARTQVGGVYYV